MQQKMEAKLFGDKDKFGIELRESEPASGQYLFRYFFNNTGIGDFKKSGYLNTIILNYRNLVKRFNDLGEEKFTGMSPREIFDDIFLGGLNEDISPDQENKLMQRMTRYNFDHDLLGNSFTMGCYNNKQGEIVFLIYKTDGKKDPKFNSFAVEFDYFKKVYDEFVQSLFP